MVTSANTAPTLRSTDRRRARIVERVKSDRLRALLVGAALGVVWSAALAVRDGTWLVAPLVLVSSALASAALPSPAKWSAPHQRVLVGFLLPLIVALIGATFVGVPCLVAGGLD